MKNLRLWFVCVAAAMLPLTAAAAGVLRPGTAEAANVVNVTISVPAAPVADPCAAGALVNLHGLVHTVISYTADNQGGYHTEIHNNFEGVTGERLLTGVTYNATENSDLITYVREGTEQTNLVTTTLVSKDASENYLMHMTLHTRIDAGGVPTVTADNFFLECRG